MAREVGGGNLDFGSHPSVDDFTIKSIMLWVNTSVGAGATSALLGKTTATNNWALSAARAVILETDFHLDFQQDFTVVDGQWVTGNGTIVQSTDTQVGMVYDRSASTNAPTFYINGISSATTTSIPAVGSSNGDGGNNLQSIPSAGSSIIGWLIYDSVAFTAAAANRHRWYGMAPGGPSTAVGVWPMWTESLANKGSSPQGDGTETGTSVVSIPRVERCWGSLMGVGR